jgi:hypothetical protein
MSSTNTKLFWHWFECHAQTYQSIFSLTKPEFKYWMHELYIRLKTYCYHNMWFEMILDKDQQVATIVATARGNQHMFSGELKLEESGSATLGWQIIAWRIPLPLYFEFEHTLDLLKDDFYGLEIITVQPEIATNSCDIMIYMGKVNEDVKLVGKSITDMICMLLARGRLQVGINSMNLRYIENIPLEAQQGLIGISVIPTFSETDKQPDPLVNNKQLIEQR